MDIRNTRYVIVSPVKNEESYIENTIRSVISQTVRPLVWVIVNDGSTDRTREIAERYAAEHHWIRVVNLFETRRVRGGHIVRLFYRGLEEIRHLETDFIVKLDGDVSFENGFFEKIFSFFASSPRLGISSGISHIISKGRLVEERSSKGHTLGAAKVYRKECLQEIGGLVPSMGWDGIDEIKARMHDWDAEPVPGLVVVHYRPEGKAHGLFRSGIERGKGCYFMGYHPLFFLLRSVKCSLGSPSDGAGMLYGYFKALVKREQKIGDEEFVRFLQRNQLRKLMLMKHKV